MEYMLDKNMKVQMKQDRGMDVNDINNARRKVEVDTARVGMIRPR